MCGLPFSIKCKGVAACKAALSVHHVPVVIGVQRSAKWGGREGIFIIRCIHIPTQQITGAVCWECTTCSLKIM